MHHETARVNGLRLHYVEEGEGPLVLLLHGFPEFWYGWRYQISALAGAGYRVVVPDLSGYNRSERPEGVDPYRIDALVADVEGLVEHLGTDEVRLVGHDWGGVIAWAAAMRHPHWLHSLSILNAPHPAAYSREVRRTPSQALRSWYAAAFQIPWLPEALLRAGDFALFRFVLRGGPAPSAEEEARYVEAFSEPGAFTAAINYYRALVRYGHPEPQPIHVPTLLVWGMQDAYLVPELTEGLEPWVPDLRVERLPEASHWLHQENAEQVNALLLRFFGPKVTEPLLAEGYRQ